MRFSQIANVLGEQYRHTIIAMDDRYDAKGLLGPDVPFELVSLSTQTKNISGKPHHALPIHQRLQLYRGTIEQIQPDKFITYNWGSIEWALANVVPVCEHIHIEDGFGPEEAKKRLRRRNWTRRLALSNHTDVVVPSHTLEFIAKHEWRLPEEHVLYIPNGIDCARFDHGPDQSLLDSLALPDDRPIIGTIAALRTEKNLPRLINAFQKVQRSMPCHLLIIGDGPERQRLTDKVERQGLAKHVAFAGYIRNPETIMGVLDVFAISSDTEQMPYSVLEAMACGLPVIGTDVGDVKHMVSTENQRYITSNDEAYHANLGEVLTNADIARQLSLANAKKVRKDYDLDTMINRYDQLFSA